MDEITLRIPSRHDLTRDPLACAMVALSLECAQLGFAVYVRDEPRIAEAASAAVAHWLAARGLVQGRRAAEGERAEVGATAASLHDARAVIAELCRKGAAMFPAARERLAALEECLALASVDLPPTPDP